MVEEELQESSHQVEETTQTPEDSHNQNEAQAQSDSDIAKNLVAQRKKMEQLQKERDELAQKLKETESKKPQPSYRDPSDLAEWRDVEEVKKMNAQDRAQLQRELQEIKLRAKYPDIEQVLSSDNVAKFREADPDLAQIIADMPDDNKKAEAAYKYMKKMGIGQEKTYDKEKEVIAANAQKPRSSSAAGKAAPLSGMNDFIENPEAYRKALYKQMLRDAGQL
jgi:hypothetical protein